MRNAVRILLLVLILAPGSAMLAASYRIATVGSRIVLDPRSGDVWGWYLGVGVGLTVAGLIVAAANGLFGDTWR